MSIYLYQKTFFARAIGAEASDFLLLVQKKVTKEKDTRAGATGER